MTAYALPAGLVAIGASVGPALAWISVRLPEKGRPGIRRIVALGVAGAAVGGWSALALPSAVPALLTALLGWQLLLLAVVDGENFWLPDILTWPLIISGAVAAVTLPERSVTDAGVGAAAGFALLWLLAFVYRRTRGRQGLGGGDPFMLAGAGAWVGWIGLPSVLLWACAVGFSLVAARLIVRRKVRGDDRLPFGTLLAVGIWLVWLYGPLGISALS